jgi:hypothetical protein
MASVAMGLMTPPPAQDAGTSPFEWGGFAPAYCVTPSMA